MDNKVPIISSTCKMRNIVSLICFVKLMINCFDPPFSMITYKYKLTFANIRNRESPLFLSIQHG